MPNGDDTPRTSSMPGRLPDRATTIDDVPVHESSGAPAKGTAPTKQLVKLTVNLGMEVYTALKTLSTKRGTTVTECLRHAISTEQWVQETQEKGEKILVRDQRGQLFEIVFR
jgi:hypothetical protein